MAETDFVPIYAGEQSFRPAYNSRQGNAGFRAPGFIGSGTSSAQPQTAPVQGAQTSADATAALRGLYASRSDDPGLGSGEGQGRIGSGQQPTREADSLVDLGMSIAKGLGMMSGPMGFARGMYDASQRDNRTGYAAQDLFGDGMVGRALASVFGTSSPPPAPSSGDQSGEDAGGKSFGSSNIDAAINTSNGDYLGAALDIASSAPSVGSAGDYQGGGREASNASGGAGPQTESPDFRVGGPIGKPGSKPVPININAHTGEFVHRPEAVNKYGPSAMNAINALKADPAGIKKAAKVAPAKAAPNRKAGSAKSALSALRAKPASRR